MLRINLLPPYIYEGARRRNFTILWVMIFLAAIGGMIFWKTQLDAKANEIAQQTAQLEPTANEADQTQTRADGIRAANAALKAKADFVRSGLEYNTTTYPPLFDNVNLYTINRVLYSSVVPANNQVSISAYAPSLADVGHYMLAMEKNPNITNVSIGMNSIPSFPVARGGAAGDQTGGAGLMASGGGRGGEGDVPMMAGASGMGGPAGGGMMSGGGQMGGRMGGFSGMSSGGFGGGAAGGSADNAAPRPPGGGGHDFTVTLTLVRAIPAAPTYPSAGGGGGGAGGGMMSGGMASGGGMMSGGGGMMSGSGGMRIQKGGAAGGAAPAEGK